MSRIELLPNCAIRLGRRRDDLGRGVHYGLQTNRDPPSNAQHPIAPFRERTAGAGESLDDEQRQRRQDWRVDDVFRRQCDVGRGPRPAVLYVNRVAAPAGDPVQCQELPCLDGPGYAHREDVVAAVRNIREPIGPELSQMARSSGKSG